MTEDEQKRRLDVLMLLAAARRRRRARTPVIRPDVLPPAPRMAADDLPPRAFS